MGHAQLVRGSANEIRRALESEDDRDDLVLIIPDRDEPSAQIVCDAGPEKAERVNGVAIFPTRGLPGIVTDELVRSILDDEL
jgi:hypothetical protein